jgi:hypothetical protein
MNRILVSTFALVMFLALASNGIAQDYSYGVESRGDPGSYYPAHPYGGFGLEYVQAPVAGSVLMDQFGGIAAMPQVVSPVRDATANGEPRAARSRSRKAPPRPRFALPTGSLYWAGASDVILYSPSLRTASYGYGYERSPYGSIDCGPAWKGWPIGY